MSTARAQCANEPNIKKWFEEYSEVLEDLGITFPNQIWSGDETGVQNVPKEQMVVGEEGTPTLTQVSGGQGETSTILTFVNAIGLVCPPMVIHHGQHVQEYWTCEAPIGICVAATTKGYITKAKFHEYGICFVSFLNSHKLLDRPHILLIDSHKTHVYNLPFFDEMWENNIHVMAIPPHTSHIVQALDSTPFAQFKKIGKSSLVSGILIIMDLFWEKANSLKLCGQPGNMQCPLQTYNQDFAKQGFPLLILMAS